MNTLNKKQIPQFAALSVLSAGVFGYFVVKIVTPSPAAAGTRPHPISEAAATAPAVSPSTDHKAAGPDTAPAGAEAPAPAPTPGMRDPFVVGYVDPETQSALPPGPALPAAPGKPAASLTKPGQASGPQVASIHEIGPAGVPDAPAFPFGLKGFAPLPAAPALPASHKLPAAPNAPAAPAWTVTGVLQSDAGQVAILRNGEGRRIVRTGDFVDSMYRVVAVTRSAVVLRHGKTFYRLTLGEAKTAAPAPTTPPLRPVKAPAQIPVDAGLAAFHGPTAMPALAAMRFLDSSAPATGSHDARARLERGRGLYQSGQRAEGRAQWRQVLMMDDLDAADEAGKLLDCYN